MEGCLLDTVNRTRQKKIGKKAVAGLTATIRVFLQQGLINKITQEQLDIPAVADESNDKDAKGPGAASRARLDENIYSRR